MKENFEEIGELLNQISIEQHKYQAAITGNKPFEELKNIYLQLREYQKHLQLSVEKWLTA